MKNKINTPKRKVRYRDIFLTVLSILLIILVINMIYNTTKPPPENVSFEGSIYNISEKEIDFLYDLNYQKDNENIIEQEIFKEIFNLVDNAEEFIIIDMFLFNTDYSGKERLIPLTTELTNKLIQKKNTNPNIDISLITDEINNFYGSYTADHLNLLENSGINVVITDLTKLRDSNPIYSTFWRTFFQWFGTEGTGVLKHPLGNEEKKVTLRAYLKLLNTKANHRKVIVADSNSSVHTIITSANPHEASSKHSNSGFLIKSGIWQDVILTEKAVTSFSNAEFNIPEEKINKFKNVNTNGEIQVQLLTEEKIKISLLKEIDSASEGDSIDIAMFYFSDRDIMSSIVKASERNVTVRIVLDPNKDAFAREKNGIPNRPVAQELIEKSNNSIQIRWYKTQGEQFHTKTIIIKKKDKLIIFSGSANLTKRNLSDLNLETNVKILAPLNSTLSREVETYFQRIWSNKEGIYTLDFSNFQEDSTSKYLLYRFQESSGFSSF